MTAPTVPVHGGWGRPVAGDGGARHYHRKDGRRVCDPAVTLVYTGPREPESGLRLHEVCHRCWMVVVDARTVLGIEVPS